MFCKQCGNKLDEGAKFCNSCGATVAAENNANQNNGQPMNQNYAQPQTNSNAKLYKILSYIVILFLVGLFANKENDKSVRFHVGQGMMVCILEFAGGLIVGILSAILVAIFKEPEVIWGIQTGRYTTPGFVTVITSLLSLAVSGCGIALSVIGIVNVVKGEDKKLPVIGDMAFYK